MIIGSEEIDLCPKEEGEARGNYAARISGGRRCGDAGEPILRRIGYKGYYCFEWEKVWHPDLLEPEVAFPDYVRVVSEYLKEPLKKS